LNGAANARLLLIEDMRYLLSLVQKRKTALELTEEASATMADSTATMKLFMMSRLSDKYSNASFVPTIADVDKWVTLKLTGNC
jgi:hypothetical protein